ncbi:MAG: hypothetical protein N2578_10055, partial [Bdellovibrionaceae bacterium]|nr:hypothetical protein [Pseudobdellovibrionaceae bacterium]
VYKRQLTSCSRCLVPPAPSVNPPLSQKASDLLEIMSAGCQIRNKSDPPGYRPPTRDQILSQLNRCGDLAYPDTPQSADQARLIKNMQGSLAWQKKMFGGLWYQPPFTEQFETHFGLENKEARYLFCYGWDIPETLYPTDYYQTEDPFNYRMPPAYVAANRYRSQLRACRLESLRNPWRPPPVQTKKCEFEVWEGELSRETFKQAEAWLKEGLTVQMENGKSCGQLKEISALESVDGKIRLAIQRCHGN